MIIQDNNRNKNGYSYQKDPMTLKIMMEKMIIKCITTTKTRTNKELFAHDN